MDDGRDVVTVLTLLVAMVLTWILVAFVGGAAAHILVWLATAGWEVVA